VCVLLKERNVYRFDKAGFIDRFKEGRSTLRIVRIRCEKEVKGKQVVYLTLSVFFAFLSVSESL
jgi:hypothetical protein